jgi:hypothetical protein
MSVPISAMSTRAVVSLTPREADGGPKGLERLSQARVDRGEGRLERVDLRQMQLDQEAGRYPAASVRPDLRCAREISGIHEHVHHAARMR